MLVKNASWFGHAILWLTWGRREEYPPSVNAHWRLWLSWLSDLSWLTKPYMKAASTKRNHGSRQRRLKRQREGLT
jgi:hypothetical protein